MTLWELRLAAANGTAERLPSLELLLGAHALELRGQRIASQNGAMEKTRSFGKEDRGELIFRVPLERSQLAEFRSHDPVDSTNGSSVYEESTTRLDGSSWRAYYAHVDEAAGVEWQLRLRDLSKKAQWERWKIMESPAIPYSASRK